MACAVLGCKHHSSRKENAHMLLSFHRFPNDESLRNEWIKRIRPNWIPKKHSKICSAHFTLDDFELNTTEKWRRLKHNAMPTLYLPKSEDLMEMETLNDRNISILSDRQNTYLSSRAPDEGQSAKISATAFGLFPVSISQATITPSGKSIKRTRSINIIENTDLQQCKCKLELAECKKKIKTLEKDLSRARLVNKRRLRKINTLIKRITRTNSKSQHLYDILIEKLHKENIDIEHIKMLQSVNENDVIKRFLQKQAGSTLPKKYSTELKKFAVTLHYLSPKAYTFIRDQFQDILPHAKTISAWYKGVDCNPGFTTEAFDSIRSRVQQMPEKIIYCGLAIDEMSIRKLVEWDSHNLRYYGYVNLGYDLDTDYVALATQSLTFMVTSLNDTWKIPVGYFLISSITAQQKASLVEQCIHLLSECGVAIVSLTYDGAANNIAMTNYLTGGNCDLISFKCANNEVCLWPDPCHNTSIKLVRNAFADKQILIDEENKVISWKHIELLYQLQEDEGLHLGNHLKKEHVQFSNQKMKVRLATQLFSDSVADALQYCKEKEIPGFEECQGTVRFLKIFNKLFDIFNSRNMRAKGFKKALTTFNFEETITFLFAAEIYLKNLKTSNGTFLIYSNRKTGFNGFITCINSLLKLFNNMVATNNLSYLCTYKMSQDHLELFFGAIRSKCGFNNNPSARMFQAAYKRLLVHAQFKDGSSGNCVPLENIGILNTSTKPIEGINNSTPNVRSISDDTNVTLHSESMQTFPSLCVDLDHDYTHASSLLTLSEYSLDVVYYIAGFVVRKLEITLKCETCLGSLRNLDNSQNVNLITFKDRGGLIKASKDVFLVCKATERFLKELKLQIGEQNLGQRKHVVMIINKVFGSVVFSQIFSNLADHSLEQDFKDNHRNLLLKAICQLYLTVRIHHVTRQLCVPGDKIRNLLTKTVIFRGQ